MERLGAFLTSEVHDEVRVPGEVAEKNLPLRVGAPLTHWNQA